MTRAFSPIWFRPLAYLLLLCAMYGALAWLEINGGGMNLQIMTPASPVMGTSEYSWPENLQLLFLGVIALMAADCVRRLPMQRPVSVLLLGLAGAAFIRECDWYLDVFVRDHVWQLLLAMLVVWVAVYQLRHASALASAVARVPSSVGFALIGCAVAGLLVFAGVVGHEPLWLAILGDDYVRVAKLATEELSELFCYWLWFTGQSEYWIECRRRSGFGRR